MFLESSHSNAAFNITASDIKNTDTGSVSSQTDLTLKATGGDIDNDGALYASHALALLVMLF
ncbi:hypothetical protein [Celerinatantimonas yamalensis]|uniref:Uncharacterized protein n=1 Tax=Celerinatantimonas yamalensis TaxID=559956 RepID=A0ABW9G5Q5_9GAMM